jgi:hypothetical protein
MSILTFSYFGYDASDQGFRSGGRPLTSDDFKDDKLLVAAGQLHSSVTRCSYEKGPKQSASGPLWVFTRLLVRL